MNPVDPFANDDILENMPTGKDIPVPTDTNAHSQEEQQNPSSSKSLIPTGKSLYSIAKTNGGHLSQIVGRVNDAVADIAKLNSDQAQIVRDFFEANAHGTVSSMSLVCEGDSCPFIHVCPIAAANAELPVGQRCPVEDGLVRIWVDKNLESLGIQDHEDPSNSFDMEMLYELATHKLIQWRAQAHLSNKGALVEEKIIGYSNKGQPMFAEVLSPLLETISAHNSIAMKIRDALVATRKSQIQAGQAINDSTLRGADLRAKAKAKIQDRLNNHRDIKDADYTELDAPEAPE